MAGPINLQNFIFAVKFYLRTAYPRAKFSVHFDFDQMTYAYVLMIRVQIKDGDFVCLEERWDAWRVVSIDDLKLSDELRAKLSLLLG